VPGIGIDAARHAEQAGEVHQEEGQINADEDRRALLTIRDARLKASQSFQAAPTGSNRSASASTSTSCAAAFNRLKDFRRIATRYDKLGHNCLCVSFICVSRCGSSGMVNSMSVDPGRTKLMYCHSEYERIFIDDVATLISFSHKQCCNNGF
jgi:hypothetical protein